MSLYGQRKRFLESVDSQLIWLENDFAALKGCATDSEAVEGGASKSEDHLLNNIVKRDKLKQNKKLSKEFVEQVEKTLDMLPKQQKVYKLKNEALRNFTLLRSGYIET